MLRFTTAAGLAALMLAIGMTSARAQESGGIELAPQVLADENAQGKVLEHVLGRLQQVQQLRLVNPSGAPTGSNLANTASSVGDPQATGTTPADALSQASTLRRHASAASFQQQIINNSQSLTVNAYESPVSIGSNNTVTQQVTSSTAVSANGPATASAGAVSPQSHGQEKRRRPSGGTTVQDATSNASSQNGGVAHAVAINTDIVPQGGH